MDENKIIKATNSLIKAQNDLQIARETLQSSKDELKNYNCKMYIYQNELELLMRLLDLKKYGVVNQDNIDEIIENDRFENLDEEFKDMASNIFTIDGELNSAITYYKNKLKFVKNIINDIKNKKNLAKTNVSIAKFNFEKEQTNMIITMAKEQ